MSTAHAADTTRPISIERLREAVSGRVIGPDDADYDKARTVTSGTASLSAASASKMLLKESSLP